MSKFKIAIVGCGDIARFTAVGCLLNRKVSATACMDIDAEKARLRHEPILQKYHIPAEARLGANQ